MKMPNYVSKVVDVGLYTVRHPKETLGILGVLGIGILSGCAEATPTPAPTYTPRPPATATPTPTLEPYDLQVSRLPDGYRIITDGRVLEEKGIPGLSLFDREVGLKIWVSQDFGPSEKVGDRYTVIWFQYWPGYKWSCRLGVENRRITESGKHEFDRGREYLDEKCDGTVNDSGRQIRSGGLGITDFDFKRIPGTEKIAEEYDKTYLDGIVSLELLEKVNGVNGKKTISSFRKSIQMTVNAFPDLNTPLYWRTRLEERV